MCVHGSWVEKKRLSPQPASLQKCKNHGGLADFVSWVGKTMFKENRRTLTGSCVYLKWLSSKSVSIYTSLWQGSNWQSASLIEPLSGWNKPVVHCSAFSTFSMIQVNLIPIIVARVSLNGHVKIRTLVKFHVKNRKSVTVWILVRNLLHTILFLSILKYCMSLTLLKKD